MTTPTTDIQHMRDAQTRLIRSGAAGTVYNYASQDCEGCMSPMPRSHRHSFTEFRVLSGSRRNWFHKVLVGQGGQLVCSCERGQQVARARRQNGELLNNCIHVHIAQWMLDRNVWVMPVAWDRHADRPAFPFMTGDDDRELFDGDEIDEVEELPAPAPVPAPKAALKDKYRLEDFYNVA